MVCSGSDEDFALEYVAELGCGRMQCRAVPTGMIVNEDVAFGSSRERSQNPGIVDRVGEVE